MIIYLPNSRSPVTVQPASRCVGVCIVDKKFDLAVARDEFGITLGAPLGLGDLNDDGLGILGRVEPNRAVTVTNPVSRSV